MRAKRPTAARKGRAGRDHRIGRLAVFDPIHHGAEKIKTFERGTARAVTHAGHQIELARLLPHLLHSTGVRSHALVVIHCIECREPRIARTVVKKDLATMTEKAREIGPVGGIGQALQPARCDSVFELIDIDAFPTVGPTGLRAPVVKMPGMETPSVATPLSHGKAG